MKFVKLTDLEGNIILVAPHWVTKIKYPRAGDYSANAKAIVVMGNAEQAVKETPEEVAKKVEENDG